MSSRPGSSRTLGPSKQCAIYLRSGLRCAWCRTPFEARADASIDHLSADPSDNDPTNLVGCCRLCNRLRQCDWYEARPWSRAEALATPHHWLSPRLVAAGTTLLAACHRVARQRCRPLDLVAGRLLAERWHPARLAYDVARWQRLTRERSEARRYEREERAAIAGAMRPDHEEVWNEVFGS